MTLPDFQTLMLLVLRMAARGEVRLSDLVERLADQFQLTDRRSYQVEDRQPLPIELAGPGRTSLKRA